MGHERVGYLPKTRKWNDLVKQMESLYDSGIPVAYVATLTLKNVRNQYEILSTDDAVKAAFSFLVKFSCAFRSQNPHVQLQALGIPVPEKATLLSVVKILKNQVPIHEATSEYGQLALAAAADAIGQWYEQNTTTRLPFFKPSIEFLESWRNLSNGSGFCELARLFFGRLTERYLNYFLERAASATFPNFQQREQFQQDIHAHLDDVSKHAFETAKITQSFAAGWFNSYTRDGVPNKNEIERFLAIAFGKLRDELRREEEAK